MSIEKNKFHGLSTPEELQEMWRKLKKDKDPKDLNVIWEYKEPKQLKSGFNIVNILYDPNHPTETGHYVLITVNDKKKEVEYFNPVASHTVDNLEKMDVIDDYFKKKDYTLQVNLSGKQKESSDNCGFHCLTHAYNYYNDESNLMFPDAEIEQINEPDEYAKKQIELLDKYWERKKGGAAPNQSAEELLNGILRATRGIYYTIKFGDSRPSTTPKTKGAGLADYGKKNYNYTDLKDEMEC